MTSTEIQTQTHDADIAVARQQQAAVPSSLSSTVMTMEEKMRWSDMMSKGNMVPQQYRGNPANVLFALEYAESVHVPAIHALTSISVVNGRPAPMTNLMVTLARQAGHKVTTDYDPQTQTATCVIWRRDEDEPSSPIVWDEAKAKKAGLWGGKGPWSNYTDQMLKWRAQSEAIRTHCVEVLAGVTESAEEVRDREGDRVKATAERTDRRGGQSALERAKKKPAPEEKADPSQQALEGIGRCQDADQLDQMLNWAANQGLSEAQLDALKDAAAARADELGLVTEGEQA
ncbi:hypothetical protein ACT3S7_06230 [Corynebacterium sp. AOP34-AQ2-28]|uniref:hypothetical protein n=1 Tax=unclassified Corynebacterium TaxID=2624378 RepID=UPI004033C355